MQYPTMGGPVKYAVRLQYTCVLYSYRCPSDIVLLFIRAALSPLGKNRSGNNALFKTRILPAFHKRVHMNLRLTNGAALHFYNDWILRSYWWSTKPNKVFKHLVLLWLNTDNNFSLICSYNPGFILCSLLYT